MASYHNAFSPICSFGFMLVWGDFVFIPFVFSVQTWFLLHNADPLSTAELIG
jgi:Ergosterol biosynthesis ERG4/ERG24 family